MQHGLARSFLLLLISDENVRIYRLTLRISRETRAGWGGKEEEEKEEEEEAVLHSWYPWTDFAWLKCIANLRMFFIVKTFGRCFFSGLALWVSQALTYLKEGKDRYLCMHEARVAAARRSMLEFLTKPALLSLLLHVQPAFRSACYYWTKFGTLFWAVRLIFSVPKALLRSQIPI